MPLSDTAIRKAQPREKPYKLSDSLGLFVLVQPSGGKLWRLKYRFGGKENKLALGKYPDVCLAEARKLRDANRDLLAQGKDPAMERKKAKFRAHLDEANTFEDIAREYCSKRERDGHRGWTPATVKRSTYLLSQIYGNIGNMKIQEIEPADVLFAVRIIEAKGTLESAKRTLQLAGAVFRYAVATARLRSDPTRDLRGALLTPKVTHYGAILDPDDVGKLLQAIDGYQGYGVTKMALQLAPHVFVRPGELRHAEWSEFDFYKAVWTIPAHKMKMKKAHHVPLSRQVITMLNEFRMVTGPDGYLFPSVRTRQRPMSDNTMNGGLRRLGYTTHEMTAHGFRAMASTLLNESGKWSHDAIERALAHGDTDRVRAAYHRGAHWKERVAMAQWWSDYLDALREGRGEDMFDDE